MSTNNEDPKKPDQHQDEDKPKPADQTGNVAEDEEKLADEWGEESFPGSDPPANY